MAMRTEWFLLDRWGNDWAPLHGSYDSLRQAREQRDFLNKAQPLQAPFKVMERKIEVYEVE